MRRLAVALRSLLSGLARAIDVEGALILSGIALVAWIGWTVEWRVGLGIIAVALLVSGIALARPQRT